ncbi:unnamed protein product [Effrenium voratum]|uniref:Uncharacterized protein n=1 Tax=Effrenium voratum TaxID=2562239 RepID=A0AA36IYK1_9DINO|nr:unnamed protein product [Effrenium voratum]CAJ1460269.1 unnamed protein product [Effrenium voratum]
MHRAFQQSMPSPALGSRSARLLQSLKWQERRRMTCLWCCRAICSRSWSSFLGISRATLTADIAPAFFSALRKKNVRLHLVFDNVLDSGVQSDLMKDTVKELARGATEHGHQVIFTVQAAEAAESVGFLNGATTRIARQQNHSYGAYRWTETDTTKLVETLCDGQKSDAEELLRESAIPDEVGLWRPRDTKLFISYRLKPSAQRQAGTALPQPAAIWACQLRKDGEKFEVAGNTFQVKGVLANVDELKEAIEKKDGGWVKEDEESKANPRQIATGSCYRETRQIRFEQAAGIKTSREYMQRIEN